MEVREQEDEQQEVNVEQRTLDLQVLCRSCSFARSHASHNNCSGRSTKAPMSQAQIVTAMCVTSSNLDVVLVRPLKDTQHLKG